MAKIRRSDFYTPLESVTLLGRIYGFETKDVIADHLRDGVINATAGQIWDSTLSTLERAWGSAEQAKLDRRAKFEVNVKIDPELWRESKHWDFDQDSWLWSENMFVITRRKKPADRTIIANMLFPKFEIDGLANAGSKPRGAPTKYVGWAKLASALIEISHEPGGLNRTRFATIASLIRKVEGLVDQDEDANRTVLGDEATKKFLAEVHRRLAD